MKKRLGFVSNSSSSSYIVVNRQLKDSNITIRNTADADRLSQMKVGMVGAALANGDDVITELPFDLLRMISDHIIATGSSDMMFGVFADERDRLVRPKFFEMFSYESLEMSSLEINGVDFWQFVETVEEATGTEFYDDGSECQKKVLQWLRHHYQDMLPEIDDLRVELMEFDYHRTELMDDPEYLAINFLDRYTLEERK